MKEASDKLNVSYTSFIRYAKKYNLYNPNQGLKGVVRPHWKNTKALFDMEKVLRNEQKTTSSKLKSKLYNAGLKTAKCEICGISDWNGKQITLHLDHTNGNHDNRLENLQILCPNCHSQTPTYCRGQGKKMRSIMPG